VRILHGAIARTQMETDARIAHRRATDMDEQAFGRMLREGTISAEAVLRQTAADQVDGMMELLLHHLPYDEVRRALYERIDRAPRGDFEVLRTAYFKHCARPSGR
jgi:hypothetical protein